MHVCTHAHVHTTRMPLHPWGRAGLPALCCWPACLDGALGMFCVQQSAGGELLGRGRGGGAQRAPLGSPSLQVVPGSRNVCWWCFGSRSYTLEFNSVPSSAQGTLVAPCLALEGSPPLHREDCQGPVCRSILGLSGPGKLPPKFQANGASADHPRAKRQLVQVRLVRAGRAAGLQARETVARAPRRPP